MPFINDMLEYYAKKKQEEEKTPINTDKNAVDNNKKSVTRFRFDVEQIMNQLRSRIFGQEEALQAIEKMLKLVRADITEPNRPLYIALFLGPTGVGKTEIVRILAEAIYGESDHFCRVDMNTLSQEHYAAALTGAPPGYVGSKEGFTVLEKEKIEGSFSKPGIVLFDEIEKASQQVIQTLLNVFDYGIMKLASGDRTINFRNSIIFMTSNLGAREIFHFTDNPLIAFIKSMGRRKNGKSALENIVLKKVEEHFAPEFINRIDEIVVFHRLKRNSLDRIIDVHLNQLNDRLEKHQCRLHLSESARDFLLNKGTDRKYGARALKRAIRKYIEEPLSSALMDWSTDKGFATLIAKCDANKIVIEKQ